MGGIDQVFRHPPHVFGDPAPVSIWEAHEMAQATNDDKQRARTAEHPSFDRSGSVQEASSDPASTVNGFRQIGHTYGRHSVYNPWTRLTVRFSAEMQTNRASFLVLTSLA